jgi:hypothetical protein
MITALLIVLFLGGSDSPSWPLDEVVDKIEMVVLEEARADSAKAAANEMGQALDRFAGHYQTAVGDFRAVHVNHDSSDGDIEQVFVILQRARETLTIDLVRARLELKESMTREEWEQVFVIENIDSEES